MLGQFSAFSEVPLAELKRGLEQQLRSAAGQVLREFPAYFDRIIRETVVDGLKRATADEGTIWLIDQESETLCPVFNSGPYAEKFVGKFQQSLRSGMISMVVATEHPICENGVQENRQQDRRLDDQLGVRTCAMIAVPFYFAGELRGALSGVQLCASQPGMPDPAGFTYDHLLNLQRTAVVLARLIEHRLILRQFGIEGWI